MDPPLHPAGAPAPHGVSHGSRQTAMDLHFRPLHWDSPGAEAARQTNPRIRDITHIPAGSCHCIFPDWERLSSAVNNAQASNDGFSRPESAESPETRPIAENQETCPHVPSGTELFSDFLPRRQCRIPWKGGFSFWSRNRRHPRSCWIPETEKDPQIHWKREMQAEADTPRMIRENNAGIRKSFEKRNGTHALRQTIVDASDSSPRSPPLARKRRTPI